MKKAIYGVMVMMLVLFPGCIGEKKSKAPVDKVIVTPDKATLNVGEELQLKGVSYDTKGKESAEGIMWSSSNNSIATVIGGKVRGVAAGQTEITASKDGKTAKSVITVLTNSEKYPKLHVASPEWQDQIIYFVLTDRFNDGNSENNNQGAGEYNQGHGDYYSGGDLTGITQKVDYIKDLGATAVWITPPVANLWWDPMINFSGYHGYWARDFKAVDEHYGTLDDYKKLSNTLHQNDMYLVQDVVVNHMGNFFEYDSNWSSADATKGYIANKNAKPGVKPTQAPFDKNNPAVQIDKDAGIYHWTPELNNYNDPIQEATYQLQKLDDLNTSNPLVRTALKDSYGYWIKEVGVDAFRVDTVKFVEHDFYNDWFHGAGGIIETAKSVGKNSFFAFGEIFEASEPYKDTGDKKVTSYLGTEAKPELPAVLQFPLRETIDSVFAGGKPTGELAYRLNLFMNKEYYRNPYITPTFIDNHDMARLRTKTDTAGLKQAIALIMTIPGIPVIYQGTEQEFIETRSSMFKNGYGSGGRDNFNTSSEMYLFIKKFAELRKNDKVFTRGTMEVIADNKEKAGILAYKRVYEGKTAVVIFNSSNTPVLMTNLSTGISPGKKLKLLAGVNYSGELAVDKNGAITETIPARAVMVLEETNETVTNTDNITITFLDNMEGKTITGNTVIKGNINKQVRELLLVIDGNMEKAVKAEIKLSGEWSALIDASGFVPGLSQHKMVMYAVDEKAVSGVVNFSSNMTITAEKIVIDDAAGDDKGPAGVYLYPTDSSFTKQMDIEKLEAESQGTKLTLKFKMGDVTDSWKPANGFDHVSFNIYFDIPDVSGSTVLPKISATAPAGFEWNYGHFVFGWNNAVYTNSGADKDKWGDPASVSPAITVDKSGKTITFTYNANDFKISSWNKVKVYVTTWDFDGVDNIYRPLLEKAEPYRFGGRLTAEDPLIMDQLNIFELKGAADPNEPIVITGEAEVKVGKTIKLSANMDVSWSSSDDKTATIDSTGLVTGVVKGKVTISAISGNKKAEKAIEVSDIPAIGTLSLVGTVTNWTIDDEANVMTDMGNGLFEKSINLAAGDYEFKFAINKTWDNPLAGEKAAAVIGTEDNLVVKAMGGTSLKITEAGDYTFVADTIKKVYKIVKIKKIGTLSLVGTVTNWTIDDEANVMTDMGNGIFEKSINLAAGDYEFKFAIDKTWDNPLAGEKAAAVIGTEDNLVVKAMGGTSLKITEAGDYLFIVDTANKKYSVKKGAPPLSLYLVGTVISDKAKQWAAGDVYNLMNNKGNGVYEKAIEITTTGALSFQFASADWKVKYTGESNINPGVEGKLITAGMANASVNISAAGKYIFTADIKNMIYSVKKEYLVLYLVGTVIGDKTKQWAAGDVYNLMTDKGNGVYEKIVEITTTGALSYQFATADWQIKYTGEGSINTGVEGILISAGMENGAVNIAEQGYYKITIDIDNKRVITKKYDMVKFVIKVPANTPSDDSIYLAGSFNDFNAGDGQFRASKQSDGTYVLVKRFDEKTFHDFRITRGSWSTGECRANGEGISNRLFEYFTGGNLTVNLEVEEWLDKKEMPTTTAGNIKIIENFDMPQLNKKRTIRVYLPKDYETTTKKYPVIYMHDGQNIFDAKTSFGGTEWRVDEIMEKMFDEKKTEGIIVVGIDNGGADRTSEYSPWDVDSGDMFRNAEGKGELYASFIVDTLKPYIDSNFRTLADRSNTGISGSSFGGFISMYTGIKYQNIFGKIGAYSTFVFEPGSNSVRLLSDFIKATGKKESTKIYMNIGDREIVGQWKGDIAVQANTKLYNAVKEAGFTDSEVKFEIIAGGQHNESAWEKKFESVVNYLYY